MVLGILSVLACILLPVAIQAKNAANRSVCLSNLHQAQLAMNYYINDYDDRYTPVNYQPGVANPDPKTDRTWVQLLLPYANSLAIFRCPADNTRRYQPSGTFDEDLVPTDTYQRYYEVSQRVNYGFNYAYLSPIAMIDGIWQSQPRTMSSVAEPSKTLLFVDSVWSRSKMGLPEGGGNWLVMPPCRYEVRDGEKVDTFSVNDNQNVYLATSGWSADPNSATEFGHAWPWHNGRMNVVRVDGSASTVGTNALGAGCDVQPNLAGYIFSGRYIWSSQ